MAHTVWSNAFIELSNVPFFFDFPATDTWCFFSGLDFTLQSLERSEANPGEELSVSFTKGYENTLRTHHSFVIRPVFSVECLLFLSSFPLGSLDSIKMNEMTDGLPWIFWQSSWR